MRFRPCVPPAISPHAKTPSRVVSARVSMTRPAVLVVEHGVGEDRLGERVDATAPVAAQHVGKRDLGVLRCDPGRIEPHRRPAVLGEDAPPGLDLVEDRLRHLVTRPQRVRELLAVGVQEHRPVRAGGLGNGVPLHGRRPGAAVRVVLERVEVTRLGTGVECDPGRLAGGVGMVGGELAARRGLGEAAPSGREDDGRRLDLVWAVGGGEGRAPAARGRLERVQPVVGEHGAVPCFEPLAQRLGDRVAGSVSHLEQAPPRGAAAAGQAVTAVLPRERTTELLEPGDRGGGLRGEHFHEVGVGRVVRRPHHVLRMDLRRVVLPERRLDPALRLRGVVRLERRLRGHRDANAPSRAAETAAASPAAPLPTTSTSVGATRATTASYRNRAES